MKIEIGISGLMIYLFLMNLVSFGVYGLDKRLAIKGKYRVSEAILCGLAFLGGALGSFAAMRLFHHKTKKIKFKLAIPAFFILHVLALILLWQGGLISWK